MAGRKPAGNEQFNCRITPNVLKEIRKLAAYREERLGVIIEEALVAYLKKVKVK